MLKQKRISRDALMLSTALMQSRRATCARRQVGAVLTNALGHIIGTGYNGPPRGVPHCIDEPCNGAHYPSGEGLEHCQAVHAEQNAMLQCKDVLDIDTLYCTDFPCMHCLKMLMNTGCNRIVYLNDYPHNQAKALWLSLPGKTILHVTNKDFS